MVSSARIRLLEFDPDLGSFLTSDDLAEARQLAVPVVTVERGDGHLTEIVPPGGFGALILEGMVLGQLRVSDQLGMRLLGPGDIVPLTGSPPPMLVAEASFRALPETRLALLGREVAFAITRWPGLSSALQLRAAQQTDRLAIQLVICQLPRVDQRLLALFWLLAESWGRVTPAGTTLPLKLTHEALGALIGARRPTVTLALRELTERGAIVHQTEGWLLLEAPPEASGKAEPIRPPALVEDDGPSWAPIPDPRAVEAEEAAARSDSYETLKETVAILREQHARNRDVFAQRMRELSTAREWCEENRRRIALARVSWSPRRSPSS
jgi:CRP/FNR family transcriptional regulator, cyclic AMP receptor protein